MAILIFKPTEDCNSNCAYCDAVKKRSPRRMSEDTLDLLMMRIDEFLRAHPEERLALTWHGGEPLLLGPAFFEKAYELQQRRCPDTGARIGHLIQSNATLFTEAFAEPFRKLGIDQVGTSYDPLPNIRGPGTPPDSREYNRLFMQGTSCLERCGFKWGIIYTAHRQSLEKPLDLFHFLMNFSCWGGVNINPISFSDDSQNPLSISAREYTDFLGVLFEAWWKRHETSLSMQPFQWIVENVRDGRRKLSCCQAGECSHAWLSVGPDGEASHCGRTMDWNLLDYGNIADRTIDQILADEQRRPFAERGKTLQDRDCKGCRFWTLCHGGCPLDAYTVHKDFSRKWKWCDSVRGFMERYFEPITGMRYEPNGG